ncbi:hypothetical protein [Sphingomonas mesophila]|uniref:hypothetical protein n=1 Tax=Sphingomonas mesophila TaxID=2303576 RepID=UPI0013C2DA29|nr:hypothetical protein [Sphingomonas mesophila]
MRIPVVSRDDPTPSEFHRRRAERELDKALSASSDDSALRHLELARLHHHRRTMIAAAHERPAGQAIFRTDKEA